MGQGKTALQDIQVETNYHNSKKALLVAIDGIYDVYSNEFSAAQTNKKYMLEQCTVEQMQTQEQCP